MPAVCPPAIRRLPIFVGYFGSLWNGFVHITPRCCQLPERRRNASLIRPTWLRCYSTRTHCTASIIT
jgi:hypothetical protein